jgi:hypothetical protein
VPGATVSVDVSTPTGVQHLTATTSSTGVASFSVPIGGPGNYTLTVTGVSAPYYTYVPGNNTQTTRTFAIGSR